MTRDEIIRQIASINCQFKGERPCTICIAGVEREVNGLRYVDTDLIETTAICLRNNKGDYGSRITPLELNSSMNLLTDLVPYILDKVKDGSGISL